MQNLAYNSQERTHKIVSTTSPRYKDNSDRNNLQGQKLSNGHQYPQKDGNAAQMSPQHYYYPNGKAQEAPVERERNLEVLVRDLSDKVAKMTQKIGQHEGILLKITENSISSNREECRKTGRGDGSKNLDILSESLLKLRKDFEEYKSGTILSREIEIKNQLFSELIHKSEARMRAQFQDLAKKEAESEGLRLREGQERMEKVERAVRELEKSESSSAGRIEGAFEKMNQMSQCLDSHMELINTELNKAIGKIVTFVNEKVSKPLNEGLLKMGERMERVERVEGRGGQGWKASTGKSQKRRAKAEYREVLIAHQEQIIISEKVYYIDIEGYLLDEQFYYLLDQKEERIQLNEGQLSRLKASCLLS